jgi:hypothetical protein
MRYMQAFLERFGLRTAPTGSAFSGHRQARVWRIYRDGEWWRWSWHLEDQSDGGVSGAYGTEYEAEGGLKLLKHVSGPGMWVKG